MLNYRALDWRPEQTGTSDGANVDLGLHGIRRLLVEPEFLAAELLALELLGEEGVRRVVYSLPFVTAPEEVAAIRRIIDRRTLDRLNLGVFIETPAAAIELDRLIDLQVSQLYVGTKDLAQLILGCDRSNSDVQHLFDCCAPPVLSTIDEILRVGERRGAPVTVFTLLEDLPRLAAGAPLLRAISVCCGELLRARMPNTSARARGPAVQ